ncbi:MAG: response regulator transcription factor [Nitrospirae bacterium]|nr:response regulator transcription factor [Nitrospirota bacterium]
MAKKILLIEDDPDIAGLIMHYLKAEHFDVDHVSDGNAGLAAVRRLRPDLVLLDLMLPGLDGLAVNRMIKQDPKISGIPVVIVTAKGEETDRVVGLEMGADDYVVKPFHPKELVARVKAVLRRRESLTAPADRLSIGPVSIDAARHEALFEGVPVALTAKEFDLLFALMRQAGRVMDRNALLDAVWGGDYEGTDRTVDVHVRRLRKKMGQTAPWLETVKQIGYRFREEG